MILEFLKEDYNAIVMKLIVVGILWGAVLTSMIIDFYFGIRKAKQIGEVRSSEGYNGQAVNIVNYSAEKIKISGIDVGEFGVEKDTMVTMTFVFNTNNIDGVTYGTGRWIGMYMNEFNKLE